MTLAEELKWRGFVNQTTLSSQSDLDAQKFTFYWGVDPSAPSLTIGNLASAMMARHFIAHGHKAYLLIGGATGLIGDPDGKKQERDLKTTEEIEANKKAIAGQYNKLFANLDFEVVDNIDWFKDMNFLDFLRGVGKHVPMRQMLGRDFVQSRLAENGAGISYAEFSYVLIQAYDFLHLHQKFGVNLQLCGSDQWGNSVAGVDLIRRLTGNETHVWSTPLVINKTTGEKFGKSEAGAIWLDGSMTTPYRFYQFWLNVDDESVEDYVKIYTLLGKDEVTKIINEFKLKPSERLAQKTLAYEVTKLVHGEERANDVRHATEVLFSGNKPTARDFEILEGELPVAVVDESNEIASILVEGRLASSNSDARRLMKEGGVYYFNNEKIPDGTVAAKIVKVGGDQPDIALVRRGKNQFMIVKLAKR